MESEVLVAGDSLSDCTGLSEQKGGEGSARDSAEGRSKHGVDGVKVDIWSQILPSQEGEMQLELLGMDGYLNNCSELNVRMSATLAGDVKDNGVVLGGILGSGFEQALSSQGCEIPLETILTGGSLSDCAEHNLFKADMGVNGSCGEVREVVEEKSNVLGGINEQMSSPQGCCKVPIELLFSGGSLGNCDEDSENKVYSAVNGLCVEGVKEIMEEKGKVVGGINEQILPSQGCEMPLELPVTGGLICRYDAGNEGKADMSIEGSFGEEARKVVEEKSDIFGGTDKQTLLTQGCAMPLELPGMGGSLSCCRKDNECKANTTIDGSCWEVVEEKNNGFGELKEPILPSQAVETPLESLVAGGSLNTCVYKVEKGIDGSSGKDVQEAVEEKSDILDGIDEQISSQGCKMPFELLITGSLSNCAKDDESEANLSVSASCFNQIREVIEEKSDILGMINEQTLPSQGCGGPLDFFYGADSECNCAEQNEEKDYRDANGPSDVRATEFVDYILAGSHDKKSRQNFPSQDCKIPLEQLSVVSPYADCAVGSVIFPGVEAEMCSQMSPIEEHTCNSRERSFSTTPDFTLDKSGSLPPCCHSGVVDNGSSEIFAEPGPSVADVLTDAFNSTEADSSGNTGSEEKVNVAQDCVGPEFIRLPPRRSTRARKSSQKTQTQKVARKGWKTANKKPHSHRSFEIFLKVARKKRSNFCKPARASIWGSLENITQVFYHNNNSDFGQVQNQGSQKTRGGRGYGKNKSRAVGSSQGSKMKGRASTGHIRLRVTMGKRVSQSGSKVIIPDMVDASDPVQTMFSDDKSEPCWAMNSELQKFTIGIETQIVEEIPGSGRHLTSHGNLEKGKTSPTYSALDEVHLTDKDRESIVIPDDSDRNAAIDYLIISSKTQVEASEDAIDNGYLDPGTSPDSEVINMIPDGQGSTRLQEDLHDVVQASSKDPVAPADVTSSNVPVLKSKKGKRKDKLVQAGNSNMEDQFPCQASLSRATRTEKQGDGWKMENDLYSSENLVSSTSGTATSNLLSFEGRSTELLPPVVDALNLSQDGSSESQNSKKLLPSTKAKGHKLPKSSKSGRPSKSSGRNQRINTCRQKESQQKPARKNINEEGVCDQVICKVENHQEIENNIVDEIGEIFTAEKNSSKDMSNSVMTQNEVLGQYLPPRIAWVRCDDCYKWRRIPATLADSIEETNCKWICKDNMDKAFADCSIPQEKSNAEINAELEISDASCEDDAAYDTHLTSKGVGPRRSTVAQSSSWMLIKSNLFLHRRRKTQTIDEVMVCHCKRPVEGRLGCGDECLNRMLNIECVKGTCPCGDLCSNQQFQKRGYAKLKWFKCGKKGYGLQLLEDISQGQFLIEYVGEVLDLHSYEARQKDYASRGHKHFYFMTLNNSEVIDACAKGNLGRFINHSCDPNCRTEKWMVNGEICIGLFALREIKKGEELTFDYNYVRVFGAAAKKCVCGSPQCRGYIGGDPLSTEVIVQGDSDEEYPEPVMINEYGGTVDSLDKSLSTSTSSFEASEIQSKAFAENKLDNFETAVEQIAVGPANSESQKSLEMVNSIGKLALVQPDEVSVQKQDLINKPIIASQPKIPMEVETTSKPLCSDQRLETWMLNKASSDSADANGKFKAETVEEKQVFSKPRPVVKASRSSSSVKRGKSNSSLVNADKPPGIGNKAQVLSNKPKKLLDGSANARFEAVQEKLNELLDADGGISKRKDSSKGYLKLLLLTVASGDNGNREAIQSSRDLSMILDALLKTKSRVVLVDILNKNGLRMLHNIMKQYSREFIKIPVLRKLLKILEYLALRGILTLEHINGGPPCPGMESFRDSMLSLTEHNDKQVHQIARSFRDRWIPRPFRKMNCMDRDDGRMEFHKGSNSSRFSSQNNYWREQVGRPTEAIDCVKQSILPTTPTPTPVDACIPEERSAPGFGGSVTNGTTNTRKRKSRWDQPKESPPNQRFHPHNEQKVQPNLLESFGLIQQPVIGGEVVLDINGISRMDIDCPQAEKEEDDDAQHNLHDDVPPGFACPLNTSLVSSNASSSAPADQAQQTVTHSNCNFEVVKGHPQKRFISLLPVSYGIPLSIVQQFGTTQQGETMQSWVVAPGTPFHPFPPLPPYPRDRRDPPPSQSVNPITRNQAGEEQQQQQQTCHGSASSCHMDESTPSTSGASPPDVNVPCANNNQRIKRNDLGRRYFRQQKWNNNSKVRPPWHRKCTSWGFMGNNARNGVLCGGLGIENLANEPKGPYCSEDVSNTVENDAGNTSYQHQNQH